MSKTLLYPWIMSFVLSPVPSAVLCCVWTSVSPPTLSTHLCACTKTKSYFTSLCPVYTFLAWNHVPGLCPDYIPMIPWHLVLAFKSLLCLWARYLCSIPDAGPPNCTPSNFCSPVPAFLVSDHDVWVCPTQRHVWDHGDVVWICHGEGKIKKKKRRWKGKIGKKKKEGNGERARDRDSSCICFHLPSPDIPSSILIGYLFVVEI